MNLEGQSTVRTMERLTKNVFRILSKIRDTFPSEKNSLSEEADNLKAHLEKCNVEDCYAKIALSEYSKGPNLKILEFRVWLTTV